MHYIEILKQSGMIQFLRNSLKSEADKIEFDKMMEAKITQYSDIYESMHTKVQEIKKEVKRNANEHGEHRQPEGESNE